MIILKKNTIFICFIRLFVVYLFKIKQYEKVNHIIISIK